MLEKGRWLEIDQLKWQWIAQIGVVVDQCCSKLCAPTSSNTGSLVTIFAGSDQLVPLAALKHLESLDQLRLRHDTSPWTPVQEHPWQQHQELPSNNDRRCLLQSKIQRVSERSPQKPRNRLHHCSPLLEHQRNVQLADGTCLRNVGELLKPDHK